ncbi:MAG TPA: ATP-binding protein, partial [Armatimonadota bacterium]|nr:ATP-binding protein [Armatimonadota bacterium]
MSFRQHPLRLQLYILAHMVVLPPLLWLVSQQPGPGSWALAAALLLATLVAGSWKLELTVFQGRMSLVFAIVCLALLLEGVQTAVWCSAAGALVTTLVRAPRGGWRVSLQRQPLHRVAFNPAHCAIACTLASLAFLQVIPTAPGGWMGKVCGLTVFTAVYFLVNSLGMAVAIGFQQRLRPWKVWKEDLLWTAPGFFASAFAAAGIWIAFQAMGAWALFFLPPVYLVYYAYWLYLDRLQQANTLLKEQVAERERAEGALQKEREFLQAVLENVADGIIACDSTGAITHVNRAAREFHGIPGEAPLTEDWTTHYHLYGPDGETPLPPEEAPLVQAFHGHTVRDAEVVLAPRRGRARSLVTSGQKISDAHGEKLGAVVVMHDLTERKQAEEERAHFIREQAARAEAEAAQHRIGFLADASEMLSSSLDHEATLANLARLSVPYLAEACVVDMVEEDGTLRRLAAAHADPSRQALLGASDEQPVLTLREDHPIHVALRTAQPQFQGGASEQLLAGTGQPEVASSEPAASGSLTCVPLVARGRTLGVLTFFTTRSGHRYGPSDFSLAKDLARRAALAVDNGLLYRKVQEDDRRKSVFLAMLGHELRNPLAAIKSSMEVIRMRGTDNPRLERAMNVVHRQVDHQTRLIDDLLDVSRITQGKIVLRKEKVDASAVMTHAVESARPLIESRKHDLTVSLCPELMWLDADPTRLEQVVANLLTNAAKYTDPGGHIWLRCEHVDNTIVIRVKDTGIGIAPEMLPRIFDIFTQVDSALDRGHGGLGLGLSLVRSLVQMHGGEVEAHSEGEGRGSEFTVRLPGHPAARPQAAHPSGHDEAAGAKEHLRILLVDDNED